ncbi:hypothetical protein DSCW_26250 [Desulfosarcina widdelii]|uniref:HEAT repeat domain-containing protein n=1 Tax=Desulfosarcina widdelii TaxID=947919 RepID=A0A5K7Z2M4_9BACT|nr:HEAT repeat domain-containing protein [Desulfosarcina widdelii]BBO75208.1 hypothetical protein DSCW_26250 [Desulfosarcina widdelii]
MADLKPSLDTSRIIRKLLLAIKNSNLYPRGHNILTTCVADLYQELQAYLEQCSRLVIGVEKNRLVSDGKILHEGAKNKENIAFLLHRDGVQWISFEEGLAEDELNQLLDVFNRYRVQEEYDGGDMVTALWQANFSHIKHGTDGRLWNDEPILDIAALKVSSTDSSASIPVTDEQQQAESLAAADKSEILWKLTQREKELTRDMISEQEHRNENQDVFDILLVILLEQNEKEDYAAVLDLVRDCFEHTLARGEFKEALVFLKKLNIIYQKYEVDKFWAQAHLDDFYILIAGQHLYAGLQEFMHKNKKATQEQLRTILQLVSLLPPQCIHSLGRLLPEIDQPHFRKSILKAIGMQATKNFGPLASLAGNEDPAIAVPVIGLLVYIRKPEALKLLKRLTRSEKERSRIAAAKAMVRHPLVKMADLRDILDDPNPDIVKLGLKHLGGQKNNEAERLISDRLLSRKYCKQCGDLLLDLYDALGCCGSEQSVTLLKKRLFRVKLIPSSSEWKHRIGAAVALFRLNNQPSRKLLAKASKSLRFRVRKAYNQAREMSIAPSAR